MGHYVADNMNTESSVKALKMAIRQRKNKEIPLIYHLDRGLQYCANNYQSILSENGIFPSLTKNSDPYENVVAERTKVSLPNVKKICIFYFFFRISPRLLLAGILLFFYQKMNQKKRNLPIFNVPSQGQVYLKNIMLR